MGALLWPSVAPPWAPPWARAGPPYRQRTPAPSITSTTSTNEGGSRSERKPGKTLRATPPHCQAVAGTTARWRRWRRRHRQRGGCGTMRSSQTGRWPAPSKPCSESTRRLTSLPFRRRRRTASSAVCVARQWLKRTHRLQQGGLADQHSRRGLSMHLHQHPHPRTNLFSRMTCCDARQARCMRCSSGCRRWNRGRRQRGSWPRDVRSRPVKWQSR
jgi:hypothetical protein